MQPWQITAASVACAEKVAPIVRTLALPDTWELAKQCMAYAWRVVNDVATTSEEGERLNDALNSVPEFQVEYPDSLIFIVARVLNLFQYSVISATSNSVIEKVDCVGFSLMLEITEELDLAIQDYPDLVSSTLNIVDAEQASQMTLIAALKKQELPSSDFIETLRQEGQSISALIQTALPTYCYAFVSSLTDLQR